MPFQRQVLASCASLFHTACVVLQPLSGMEDTVENISDCVVPSVPGIQFTITSVHSYTAASELGDRL